MSVKRIHDFLCYSFFVCLFVFWLRCTACGLLVPRPGIEPGPLAVRAQSPNHWTAREFPLCYSHLDDYRE